MSENLRLSPLEQEILEMLQRNRDLRFLESELVEFFAVKRGSGTKAHVRQALAQLIALSYVSADEDLRYSAVGKEL